ncbi:MAG: hypothetical protein HUU10_05970 [Bacteroidetes bacterium]|nr:hypothetical protein [Bacteroidota bacterium]
MKKIKLSKSSRKLLVKLLKDGISQMPKSPQARQQKAFLQTLLKKVEDAPKKADITLNPMETKYLREVMIQTKKHFVATMASAGFFKKLLYKLMLGSYKELLAEIVGPEAAKLKG